MCCANVGLNAPTEGTSRHHDKTESGESAEKVEQTTTIMRCDREVD